LGVVVERGIRLPVMEWDGTCNPYVEVRLVQVPPRPDHPAFNLARQTVTNSTRRTDYRPSTINPQWHEHLFFHLADLPVHPTSLFIHFRVMHYDPNAAACPVGEVWLPLKIVMDPFYQHGGSLPEALSLRPPPDSGSYDHDGYAYVQEGKRRPPLYISDSRLHVKVSFSPDALMPSEREKNEQKLIDRFGPERVARLPRLPQTRETKQGKAGGLYGAFWSLFCACEDPEVSADESSVQELPVGMPVNADVGGKVEAIGGGDYETEEAHHFHRIKCGGAAGSPVSCENALPLAYCRPKSPSQWPVCAKLKARGETTPPTLSPASQQPEEAASRASPQTTLSPDLHERPAEPVGLPPSTPSSPPAAEPAKPTGKETSSSAPTAAQRVSDDVTVRVRIVEAMHLPKTDWLGKSDPYVEIRVVGPGKAPSLHGGYRGKQEEDEATTMDGCVAKTTVRYNTLQPRWEEELVLPVKAARLRRVGAADVKDLVLRFTLMDYEMLRAHQPIGKVEVPLADVLRRPQAMLGRHLRFTAVDFDPTRPPVDLTRTVLVVDMEID